MTVVQLDSARWTWAGRNKIFSRVFFIEKVVWFLVVSG